MMGGSCRGWYMMGELQRLVYDGGELQLRGWYMVGGAAEASAALTLRSVSTCQLTLALI